MLPIPPFFDPGKVGQVWRVPYRDRAAQAAAWAADHGLRAAAADTTRICLMAVDVQNTFCIPEFELFVAGRTGRAAVDDNIRLCRFIYRHLDIITQIYPTMDTHTAMQIFHPVFWINETGAHPAPYSLLSVDDVRSGRWKVNPAVVARLEAIDYPWLERYARYYVERLAESGKYQLTIWPYHAMLGGIGHALVSAVEEAIFFHAIARSSQTGFQPKGDNPLTEDYSVLRPEVMEGPDGRKIAEKNFRFIQTLLDFDVVIIAGQAKSHCVAWTIDDLLTEIATVDPALAGKVYLLEDCTSPVVVPGVIDYTEQADAAFRRFEAAEMHVVQSTDPLETWPGLAALALKP
ncbi:MAG TPA: isochorismatase [bacterium]|jgi:nicotinamidase-related amidase|nr:isochorismatase [bacterium]